MRQESTHANQSRLEGVRRKFESWREGRRPGARIPEVLWQAAAEVAREFGVSRTSKDLRIDYNSLRKRLDAKGVKRDSGFVEIPMGPAVSSVAESMIEIEDVKGARLRIELKGAATGDLEAVVRTILGAMR